MQAQSTQLSGWTSLIDHHKCSDAGKLCIAFQDSADVAEQVDAQKCLANVALCGHDVISLQGDDAGGGTLGGSYQPEAADEALKHLNIALKLAPQDLSIHQGRLHILEATMRYKDMIAALDESCTVYQGKDGLEAWLEYSAELANLRQYAYGLEFMQTLAKHYPDSPDVIGNIGAFLSMQNKPAEAIPYLKRAAELAPGDPIDAWDLGRAYDHTNQDDLADQWYRKGMSLDRDPQRLQQSSCLYAKFLDEKRRDPRACALERKSCGKDDRPACHKSKSAANE